MNNRHFFALLAFTLLFQACNQTGSHSYAIPPKDAEQIIVGFTETERLKHASVALHVVDAASGEVLLSHNADVSLIPASLVKVLTTATVLEVFASDHTFTTTLEYTGSIDRDGTLYGDLRIAGGGDPALGSKDFPAIYGDVIKQFADEATRLGIKKIEGDIIGDGSALGEIIIPDTWFWEDIGNYYGAAATGLNIYDNSYTITFRTQHLAGTPAVITGISPEIPGLTFDNRVLAADNNRDMAYIFGTHLSDKRIICGTIPAGRAAFTIRGAIPDPAFLAAHQLYQKLEANGVVISGKPLSVYHAGKPLRKTIISEVSSPPIAELVEVINKKSQNLYAETFLLHLSLLAGDPSIKGGCEVVERFWEDAGMPVGGLFLLDGSGLSRANGMTAGQLTFMLEHMHNHSQQYPIFRKSLPTAGVSGNLVNFGKETPLEGRLHAKSGSMSRVMNYCGYLTSASGREVAFAVMVNNYDDTPSRMRQEIQELLAAIAVSF